MQNLDFHDSMVAMPIIVSLRGIHENEVTEVGRTLVESGLTVFEVPVRTKNSLFDSLDANSIQSLTKLMQLYGKHAHIAAGTVLCHTDLSALRELGVTVCLAPVFDRTIVIEAKQLGISFVPGVETVSETLLGAVACGAMALKLFPCVYHEPHGDITIRHTPGYVRYLTSFICKPILRKRGFRLGSPPKNLT